MGKCALVGNAPKMMTSGLGKAIDSADVVIRHNGVFPPASLKPHLGSNTSIQSFWANYNGFRRHYPAQVSDIERGKVMLQYGVYTNNDYGGLMAHLNSPRAHSVLVPNPRVVRLVHGLLQYTLRHVLGTTELRPWASTGLFNAFLYAGMCQTLDLYGFDGKIQEDGLHDLGFENIRQHEKIRVTNSSRYMVSTTHNLYAEHIILEEMQRLNAIKCH
jgi:hypothetical protein